MDNAQVLKNLGLSDNASAVYLAMLEIGPSSVRKVAAAAKVNRGTTYDILKFLIKEGLVSFYHKEKNQYFSAEDPEQLLSTVEKERGRITQVERELKDIIPALKALSNSEGRRKPVAKYYEGYAGIKHILSDILFSVERSDKKEYVVYSSVDIAPFIYKQFPNFTDERIKKGIKVRVIACGGKSSGSIPKLAERKWLKIEPDTSPTYVLIYHNKIGFISLSTDDQIPVGVLIEDRAIFETQMVFFDYLWRVL